ncbi:mismatch-specific DNA-glycosylase [Mycobacterium angelicum]|uniref:Mismatch-specific DNA-glycosylase n=1 Tax=Mycobacterium angelicum TaxID=470074 RepID=A0A1X0A1E5_MYCAN|nr:mismatch-specific DNA-glycosylase [Mycobacterium angelicum]MCV7195463.1 mismatch-specific DNA-glycosylase [Mycobacterium angelicum]ORA23782.1 mismatch-specific DNA-glycosylase [Mycobacterium angelicum]
MDGVRFTRDELKQFSGKTLPDLISDQVRLLFVGINPGLRTAAVQAHFAPRGNRFWPALYRAGITEYLIDASSGFAAADRDYVLSRGIGITNLVERATAGADELTAGELITGRQKLDRMVQDLSPRVVAVLGITAYRAAFGDRQAKLGKQLSPYPGYPGYPGTELWVLPNPSGRNAHATLPRLADAYAEAAQAAGIRLTPATRCGDR